MNKLTSFLLSLLPLVAFVSFAISSGATSEGWTAWATGQLVPLLMLTAVSCVLYGALASLGSALYAAQVAEAKALGLQPLSESQAFWRKLYNPIKLNEETDALLDHDYDGIKELDNSLPPWWLYSFYASIVFSIGYMAVYMLSEDALRQEPQYYAEVEAAKIEVEAYLITLANLVDETNAELLTDVAAIVAGGETFAMYCAACHAADGGGGVGPNLTDDYWIHGDGTIRPIFATVKNGVPEKGMIAWKAQLSNAQIHEVSSFVATLRGKQPEKPKEPQGELVRATMDAEDESLSMIATPIE